MQIREVRLDELKALSELARSTYADAFGNTFTPERLEKRLQETRSVAYFRRALRKNVVLVAEEDGIVVGYAEFGPADQPAIQTEYGDQELMRLYVRSDKQGSGIGRALIDTAFAYPQMRESKNVYLDVWEHNEGAQRLYKSYGFEDTGKRCQDTLKSAPDAGHDIVMVRQKRAHETS